MKTWEKLWNYSRKLDIRVKTVQKLGTALWSRGIKLYIRVQTPRNCCRKSYNCWIALLKFWRQFLILVKTLWNRGETYEFL